MSGALLVSCPVLLSSYGDPRTAVYYSFLTPTHVLVFSDPLSPSVGRVHLFQVRRVPSARPRPWLHPDAQRWLPPQPTSEWRPAAWPPHTDTGPVPPPNALRWNPCWPGDSGTMGPTNTEGDRHG